MSEPGKLAAADPRVSALRRRVSKPPAPRRAAVAAAFLLPGFGTIIAALALVSPVAAMLFAGLLLVACGVGYLRG